MVEVQVGGGGGMVLGEAEVGGALGVEDLGQEAEVLGREVEVDVGHGTSKQMKRRKCGRGTTGPARTYDQGHSR